MNRFFVSFLGTLAAIWLSIILLGLFSVLLIAVAAVKGMGSGKTPADDHSVLLIDLNCNITESPQPRNFMEEFQGDMGNNIALNELTGVIRHAATNDSFDGIYINCSGLMAGMAQRQAIFKALRDFKAEAPEKFIYAYGDIIEQGDYFIACAADSIFINPQASIDIHGISSTGLYLKNLLDKIGVEMQVVKVGTYKSAVEPFILTGPSEASVEQQKLFLGNIWASVTKTIASARNVPADSVNAWANSMTLTRSTDYYIESHIADAKAYHHEFLDRLKKLTDTDDLNLVSPADYLASYDLDKGGKDSAKIGVYYASGDIVDTGKEGISAEQMVPELLDIADDDNIDALVIRVNSGGGSAFASEQIWEAVERYKEITGKPVYVSMSDYAASGGYYISCGADKIYAEPLTLTGSIGIFGLIPNAEGLITGKLGINTHTISTNPAGDLPTLFKPLTPAQKISMQTYVNRGYELFVKRVADGRNLPVDSVKAIAEGRVWDGREALRRGLVDKLGGLDAALADLAKELNVENYSVVEYPEVKRQWWEALFDLGSTEIEADAIRERLGFAAPIYDAIMTIGNMQGVQARMEIMSVEM